MKSPEEKRHGDCPTDVMSRTEQAMGIVEIPGFCHQVIAVYLSRVNTLFEPRSQVAPSALKLTRNHLSGLSSRQLWSFVDVTPYLAPANSPPTRPSRNAVGILSDNRRRSTLFLLINCRSHCQD